MKRLINCACTIALGLGLWLLIFGLYWSGVYMGERNMKRIAIEAGVARVEQGQFRFGVVHKEPCKPDGSC